MTADDGQGTARLRDLDKLISEPWYWPGASKAEISKAIDGKPDGTFVVRDASSPGDFTLTVRARGETKLVKVNVVNGLCGFNVQSLEFDSLQSLIECHRRLSLRTYNANLDTMLLSPLRDSRRRQSGDEEFDRYLAVERFRTLKCAFMRATKIYDLHHGEQIRADDLLKVQQSALADVNKKARMLQDILNTQRDLVTEFVPDDRRTTVFNSNSEVLRSLISAVRAESSAIEQQMARLVDFMRQHAIDLQHETETLQQLSGQLEKQVAEMRGGREGKGTTALFTEEKLQELSEQVEHMRQLHESINVSRILYELPLQWDPARFLVNDPSKEAAAVLIEAARIRLIEEWKHSEEKRKRSGDQSASVPPSLDGLFLIRPSSSQKGRLVLSVLMSGRVSHCLIEEAEHGWGFENGGLYFVSIGDFVRYYSHNSLEEHNKHIRTQLTEPVLP